MSVLRDLATPSVKPESHAEVLRTPTPGLAVEPTPTRDARVPFGVDREGNPQFQSQAQAAAAVVAAVEKAKIEASADVTERAAYREARRQFEAMLHPARVTPSLGLSGFWKIIRYRDLIQEAADLTGADAAIIAALMEVEGSGEDAVSPAGAMGLMQLMPDKLRDGDNPFDPATNILRAAQHVRVLQNRWKQPELVAAAYFGAIDAAGSVTGDSDGNVTGFEYVEFFRTAYARYLGNIVKLPLWLSSPFGDIELKPEMIKFGYLGDYGLELALDIRGEVGVLFYGTQHLGLDLQLPDRPDGGRGAAIVAPFDGVVVRSADHAGGPYGVWLESEKLGLRARLMHMDGLVSGIETGVAVKAGQQLGVLGAQGTPGFPHLHLSFERLSDGQRLNPALFYRVKDESDSATWAGRWYDAPPRPASNAPRLKIDVRLIPDGDGRRSENRPTRLLVTRWGPFELASP